MKNKEKIICLKCETLKSIDSFDKKIGCKHKVEQFCKDCKNFQNQCESYNEFGFDSKVCSSCKKDVGLENYNKHKGYFSDICRTCKHLKNNSKYRTCTYCKKSMLKHDFFKGTFKRCEPCREKLRKENSKKRTKIRSKNILKYFPTKIRNLITQSFKRGCNGLYKKSDKTENILGCTMEEFIEHLQSLFTEGMTLENHGNCEECWHIDHKIPIRSAKTEEEIIELNHYTNLQPLWRFDNLSKGCKVRYD